MAGALGQRGLNVGIPAWSRCEQGNVTTLHQRVEASTARDQRSSNTHVDQQRSANVRPLYRLIDRSYDIRNKLFANVDPLLAFSFLRLLRLWSQKSLNHRHVQESLSAKSFLISITAFKLKKRACILDPEKGHLSMHNSISI